MKLKTQLRNALMELVGNTTPLTPDALSSNEEYIKVFAIRNKPNVISELDGINQDDIVWLILDACDAAAEHAEKEATRDKEKDKPATLREALLEEVEKALSELPATHFLHIPLYSFPKENIPTLELSKDLTIVAAPKRWFSRSTNALAELLQTGTNSEINMPALKVRCSGYVGGIGTGSRSSAVINGLAKLREYVYLGQAFGILKERPLLPLMKQPKLPDDDDIVAYIHPDQKETEGRRIPARRSLLSLIARLEPDPTLLSLLEDQTSGPTTEDQIYSRLAKRTTVIKPILDAPYSDKDVSRLRSSIEWALEATIADESSTSIVQSFIALEALLGDDDSGAKNQPNSGITGKLSDRYAYLVGTKHSNRQELKSEIASLYSMRGDIVHGRKSKSTLEHETPNKYRLEHLTSIAIAAEARRYLKHP